VLSALCERPPRGNPLSGLGGFARDTLRRSVELLFSRQSDWANFLLESGSHLRDIGSIVKKNPIDEALKPVARHCSASAADDLLDLREAALERARPGECLQCYFRIFGRLNRQKAEPMNPLRQWMEENLEVIALDDQQQELERLPISLHAESLEAFCREMMAEFHFNRAYPASRIELSVAFRKASQAA